MPRFSVCVEMVFRPLPFVERLEAVARAGYDAFEFWNWQDKDLEAIEATSHRLGLAIAAFGVSGGTLMEAANHDAYVETTHRAAVWARRLGCPNLIVTTGNEVTGVSRAAQFDVLHRGLERVAAFGVSGGTLMDASNHDAYIETTHRAAAWATWGPAISGSQKHAIVCGSLEGCPSG